MTKQLPLIEIDTKHDCPVGQYEKGCFDGEGSGQCLQCGMNNQRDADQQIYDTDIAARDTQIAAQATEIERLKGMLVNMPTPEEAADWYKRLKRSPEMHGDIQLDVLLYQEIITKLKAIIASAALASKEGEETK